MESAGRLKRWMTYIGLAGLGTGVAVGTFLPQIFAAMRTAQNDTPWLVRFRDQYRLRPDQVRDVRMILAAQEREKVDVFKRNADRLPEEIQRRIEEIDRRTDDRIEVVLDAAQLAEYRKAREGQSRPSENR